MLKARDAFIDQEDRKLFLPCPLFDLDLQWTEYCTPTLIISYSEVTNAKVNIFQEKSMTSPKIIFTGYLSTPYASQTTQEFKCLSGKMFRYVP